jgi:aryl-alcohol dehydrogenase-like predicted oxidoreductase
MGGCPMGQYGWGEVDEKELVTAINIALDYGVNFFDTADVYGLGKSEETLRKGLGVNRKNAIIATKFGVRMEAGRTFFDNSGSWIEQSLTNSLRRLGTDYIDLYQLHYRDKTTPITEILDTLDRFRNKGYIRYYGLSNIYLDDAIELQNFIGSFASMQDEYSLACRKNEMDILTLSNDLQLTPLSWGSLGQGILTGKYDENVKFKADDRRSSEKYVNFHSDKLKKNICIVEQLRAVSNKNGKSIAAVAIRFILDHIPGSVVIVGAKRPTQILSNIEALGWKLDLQDINMLDLVSIKEQ